MIQNHINILSIEELTVENKDVTKFFGYPVFHCVDNVGRKFEKVYTLFNKSAENLRDCHARSEFEEAALHSLRHAMEILFYQMIESFSSHSAIEHGSLCDGAKYLISIFVHLPNIMVEQEKDRIFDFVTANHLLRN